MAHPRVPVTGKTRGQGLRQGDFPFPTFPSPAVLYQFPYLLWSACHPRWGWPSTPPAGKTCGAAPPGGRGRHAPEVVLMGRAMNWLSFISDWIHSLSFPKFLLRQMWHWEWSGCRRQHSRPPEFVSWARFPYIFTISCTAWRYLNISLA